MQDIMFPVKVVKGVPVVITPEEIDIVNAGDLRAALLNSAAHGPGAFAVDMSQTRFCDTAGLHALVRAHKRAQADGGKMLLVVPDITILRVLAITGLDRVFSHVATLDEALAQLPATTITSAPPPGTRAVADDLTERAY